MTTNRPFALVKLLAFAAAAVEIALQTDGAVLVTIAC